MGGTCISNEDVAKALREMALFLEMDEVPFKPQAYEKAAYAVTALEQSLADVYAEGGKKALDALPGIGKGIAERIAGMLETGAMADLEALRNRAVKAGARIAVDSDAHTVDELRFVETFGIGVARRGWAERKHVVNAMPAKKMLGMLKDRR